MKNNTTLNRVIDYALCHLNSNWDDWIEEDLGISNENFVKLIKKFQDENIPIDKAIPKL
jgi:beta-lactamase class D